MFGYDFVIDNIEFYFRINFNGLDKTLVGTSQFNNPDVFLPLIFCFTWILLWLKNKFIPFHETFKIPYLLSPFHWMSAAIFRLMYRTHFSVVNVFHSNYLSCVFPRNKGEINLEVIVFVSKKIMRISYIWNICQFFANVFN